MRNCLIIFFLFLSFAAKAEFINIGIYHGENIKAFEFSVRAGKYSLFSEQGKISELNSKSSVKVESNHQGVVVMLDGQNLGTFQKINFVGVGWYNHFLIRPISNRLKEQRYDDNLKVFSQSKGMQLVNNIDLDNYVAGVVEAEVGQKPPKEYFKLQAIICRTYALSNTHKHLLEGFNLCDQVHCQAYHGKSFFSPIVEASMQTRGAVIVDSDIQLITAAFHSHCGGQTVNSEDVWTKSLYYLRSVEDTFCTNLKNSYWEKRIATQAWNRYLQANLAEASLEDFEPTYQASRRALKLPNTNLDVEDMRHHFGLRSTFFDVVDHGDTILLCGKGYGHGVGLCQIGAMEMARRGYNYSDILHFYYRGVHIIDLSALDFFKAD
ncbi:MAG: SpoIID/LytB domain-containing protein [Vicingaceae bacterium]